MPWHPRRVPQPPAGEGPALEWCYANRSGQFTQLALGVIVVAVLLSIVRGGLGWTQNWVVWTAILGTGILLALAIRTQRYSAGADWFMHRKDFVKTYELTSVKFEKDFGDGDIDLDDQHGGGAKASLTWIYQYPDLWDLVYNGIRHSVATGAYVNDLAVRRLNLHDVVRIRDQRLGRHPDR